MSDYIICVIFSGVSTPAYCASRRPTHECSVVSCVAPKFRYGPPSPRGRLYQIFAKFFRIAQRHLWAIGSPLPPGVALNLTTHRCDPVSRRARSPRRPADPAAPDHCHGRLG
ncbi:unnamed protein product [Danaus chrysippus]|uniref:(African queen) hypothetical protein n=1 Tax=Danaus chrysippus TaxID=151541 RepID=A0A8J2VS43_9NEOP|nr:unnamed protein product [Danaus chrysippus]